MEERLSRELAGLLRRLEPARWVQVEGLHLTVKFVGETPPARLEDAARVLETRCASPGPVR